MTRPRFQQPALQDGFGCAFYGKAETISGDIWWYETWNDNGERVCYPLFPSSPSTEPPMTREAARTILEKELPK